MNAVQAVVNLSMIADITNGQVDGDCEFAVNNLSSLENATSDSLAFYVGPRQTSRLQHTAAGAVLLKRKHAELFNRHKVIVDSPYLAYAHVSALFAPPAQLPPHKIHPSAIIAASASIHADAIIGPYSVIGENSIVEQGVVIGNHTSIGNNCVVGQHTEIKHGVRIHSRTSIGKRCNISSGVVLGASGFGYAEAQREWVRIEQIGRVLIGDDVDIGANTTIDRGALDNTIIGNGVKLDNQIQIGHNVQVGDHTIMAACVAVAGSTSIGKYCRLGGCAAILGHITIADEVCINGTSFVAHSITEAGVYAAVLPAQPVAKWRKTLANINRLERLASKIHTFTAIRRPKTKTTSKETENE